MMTKDLCGLSIDELKNVLKELSEPQFRAAQIYGWIHKHGVKSFEEMNNIPKALKQKLSEQYHITVMDPVEVLVSKLDGTRKYVYALEDGNVIEAVLMRYKHGNSVCISSQVGCRMGCRFCASTLDGCVRNLTAAEMLAEVYRIDADLKAEVSDPKQKEKERVSNVVIMGSGEPMDNYDEVVKFIRMLSDEQGLNISARNVTLSTCGIVPGIQKLAEEGLPVTLALSLHAATQEKREEIMPIAKAYALPDVLSACAYYFEKTGRRLSFEYSVVRGVNDTKSDALTLCRLLRRKKLGPVHVNLIPVNPIKERDFESPDRDTVEAFRDTLTDNGINATVRREMGRDISSACGQLRRRHIENAGQCTD